MWFKRLTAGLLSLTLMLGIVVYTLQPVQAASGPQILVGGNPVLINDAATYSLSGSGQLNNSSSASEVMPIGGTFSSFTYYVPIVPGGVTTRTLTIWLNNVATAVTCTIASAANSCTDATHTLAVVPGGTVFVKTSSSGVPAATNGSWSVAFTPTTPGNTIILGTPALGGSLTRTFFTLTQGQSAAQNTEATARVVVPEAGTLDQFQATTTSILSGSYAVAVWQNGATSTLLCTVQSPTLDHCGDIIDSVSLSINDSLSFSQVPFTPGSAFRGGWGLRFVPTTAGDFMYMMTTQSTTDVAAATRYLNIQGYGQSGGSSTNVVMTAEASSTSVIASAMTVTSMTLNRASAPGAGHTATYTLRRNNADSALSCALTGSGSGAGITTKTCSGSVSIQAGDTIDYSDTLDTGGTVSGVQISLVANDNTGPAPANTPTKYQINGQVFINAKTDLE